MRFQLSYINTVGSIKMQQFEPPITPEQDPVSSGRVPKWEPVYPFISILCIRIKRYTCDQCQTFKEFRGYSNNFNPTMMQTNDF